MTKYLKLGYLGAVAAAFAMPPDATKVDSRRVIGEFRPVGQTTGAPLYIQTTTVEVDPRGHAAMDSTIKDPAGNTLLVEHAEYDGTKPASQRIEQRQKKEVFDLTFKDGALDLKRSSLSGAETKVLKSAHIAVTDTLLTGPVTENFVVAHWAELVAGKTIEARFAVMEIADTIHFSFRKIASDARTLTVEMKPSGMFIRMFAGLAGLKPIRLAVDVASKRVVRYRGRTPIVDKDGGPLDCEIAYREARAGVAP